MPPISKSVREVPIKSIRVGKRFRKEIGSLDSLAESIDSIGLLHAVVITPEGQLIAGLRRLKACQQLGWTSIPVRVVDLDQVIEGEFAENACRKNFTLSEIAAIAKRLRPIVEKRAHERQAAALNRGKQRPVRQILPNGENGKARDVIARYIGVSGTTLEKIEAVVEAAEENPEKFGAFKERMDRTGKVNRHYQQLRVARLMDEPVSVKSQKGFKENSIICGDCREVLPKFPRNSVDAVIFDPPWGFNYTFDEQRDRNKDPEGYWEWFEPIFKQTMRVLKPGGLWACWQSHNYLPHCWEWFGDDINIFAACKDEVGIGVGRSYGWEPIVMKWKTGRKAIYPYGRKRPMDFYVADWKAHLANKLASEHPCPRPLDLLEAVIENYTTAGALILDPTCGSGAVCVAAARCRPARKYIGIEMSATYADLAERRLRIEAKRS